MIATRLRSFTLGVGVLALTPFVYGQVPIDESVGEIEATAVTRESSESAVGSGQSFLQMQRLQSEVQMLRGLLEEQAEKIRRLEQQRFDDFVTIDQRLAAIEAGGGNVMAAVQDSSNTETTTTTPSTTSTLPIPTAATVNNSEGAKAAYDTAYGFLRQRDFATAKARFSDFLSSYPESDLAANAYYWLGEIALEDRELEIARERFSSVVNFFPNHRKAQDALYKLGTVYWMLEQYAQSREFYQRAAEGTGQAATLAKRALEQNF